MFIVYNKRTGQIKMVSDTQPKIDNDILGIKNVTNQDDFDKILSGNSTYFKNNKLEFKPLGINKKQQTTDMIKEEINNAKDLTDLKKAILKILE